MNAWHELLHSHLHNSHLSFQAWQQCHKTFFVRNLRFFARSQIVCQTWLEKLTRDEPSSLLRKFVNRQPKIIKLFSLKFTIVRNKLVSVPGKLLQPSLMIASKARAYPSEAPLRCSTLGQAPGLIHKHYTRQKRPAWDTL